VLRGDGFELRPWTVEDGPAFFELWGDPAVIWWGPAADRAQSDLILRRFLERTAALPPGLGFFAIVRAGQIEGNVFLAPAPFAPGVELGYHLRPRAQGQGLATRAAACLLEHAFTQLHLPRVYAAVHLANPRSQGVLSRLGFEALGPVEHAGMPHQLYELSAPSPGSSPAASSP
jgi:RimJ/RimL family protein N-acetyltransferase